ncbi:hypothetical protein JCGZ_20455 [Jatropha curcas]|uniref:Non-specific lipid-transfer protein n=1 Tax=Jatropha curcas TaxID=180498 RepID=A0A067K0I1_JATCU|nr:hypothetical protein JCGZ_20455 [Jatropha curcas]
MKQLVGVVTILLVIAGSTSIDPLPPCNEIISLLSPCVSYLIKTDPKPSKPCCDGVNSLAHYSNNKDDRKRICQCLENSAADYPQIDYSLLPSLPNKCGVNILLPAVSPTFNCSK